MIAPSSGATHAKPVNGTSPATGKQTGDKSGFDNELSGAMRAGEEGNSKRSSGAGDEPAKNADANPKAAEAGKKQGASKDKGTEATPTDSQATEPEARPVSLGGVFVRLALEQSSPGEPGVASGKQDEAGKTTSTPDKRMDGEVVRSNPGPTPDTKANAAALLAGETSAGALSAAGRPRTASMPAQDGPSAPGSEEEGETVGIGKLRGKLSSATALPSQQGEPRAEAAQKVATAHAPTEAIQPAPGKGGLDGATGKAIAGQTKTVAQKASGEAAVSAGADQAPAPAVRISGTVGAANLPGDVPSASRQVVEAVSRDLGDLSSQRVHVSGQTTQGGTVKSMRLQLYPAELGAVTIRIQSVGGEMRVTIQAESDQTTQMLSRDSDSMRQALRGIGVQGADITVASHRGDGTQTQFSGDGGRGAASQQQSSGQEGRGESSGRSGQAFQEGRGDDRGGQQERGEGRRNAPGGEHDRVLI